MNCGKCNAEMSYDQNQDFAYCDKCKLYFDGEGELLCGMCYCYCDSDSGVCTDCQGEDDPYNDYDECRDGDGHEMVSLSINGEEISQCIRCGIIDA